MKRSSFIAIAFSIAIISEGLMGIGSALVGHAQAATSCIQYGAFGKSVSYIEAVNQGYFTKEGISVCYDQVTSSTQQISSLLSGQYNIISSTADNTVNQDVNNGQSIQLIGGIDQGANLDLVVNTSLGINNIHDLEGKAILVDAPNSGFVLALEEIMSQNGMTVNQDYTLDAVGGSATRYQDMVAGQTSTGDPAYATMLAAPYIEEAQAVPNLSDIAKLSSYVEPYQGTSIALTQSYAQANKSTVNAFLTAMIMGSMYAANPNNQSAVIADIASSDGTSTQVATNIYTDTELNTATGENVNEQLNQAGLVNTINIRQAFGGFNTTVDSTQLAKPGPHAIYNDQYWQQAYCNAQEQMQ
jgi:ABC-type nitrate/sulfonate/bicarbonate transport system substrate-binding protein